MKISKKTAVILLAFALAGFTWLSAYAAFRRPCRETVERSSVSPALVYAVMKAESGFDENAVSTAGAVGIMQLLPSTAEFICRFENIEFFPERLTDADYNTALGCFYLAYLFTRFPDTQTALAAYNAGEGVVSDWLKNPDYSDDGVTLGKIPYPETARYLKKVGIYRKIYLFLYH